MPPARSTSSMCTSGLEGETLQMHGMRADISFTPVQRIVHAGLVGDGEGVQHGIGRAAHGHIEREGVVDAIAAVTMSRGLISFSMSVMICRAAARASSWRCGSMARIVPLPGSASPMASSRQFIELAVNMPAQEPQPGQQLSSSSFSCSALDGAGLKLAHAFEDGDQVAACCRPASRRPSSGRRR